jgi:tetratricopeptide (TPR) repeat protein
MAKINLRSYHQVIQERLVKGAIDEAIFHCSLILQTYPKNIRTYRLYAEAHLEKGLFAQSTDLFQRLLTVIPDDFVAHIGMSVIREAEGRVEEAIWHMERAFETQPANLTIQDELKRLYGRRDGIEPARITMTKAALARLYLRGELLPQALAEYRALLAELPQRVDAQIGVASTLLQMNRFEEAIEAANQILPKYPYCLDANRIVVIGFNRLNQPENASIHRKRWNDLDPYAQFLIDPNQDPEEVPGQSILLDWPAEYPIPENSIEAPIAKLEMSIEDAELFGDLSITSEELDQSQVTMTDSLEWVYEEEEKDPLTKARQTLQAGDLEGFIAIYQSLIASNQALEEVVDDLQTTLVDKPGIPELWQILGDCLMRLDRVDEAMQAYTNAVNLTNNVRSN